MQQMQSDCDELSRLPMAYMPILTLRRNELACPLLTNQTQRFTLRSALILAFMCSFSAHRYLADLKSPNVLLDAHNTSKLTDFGLSSMRGPAGVTTTLAGQSMAGAAGSTGTLLWMAPELHSDEDHNGGAPGKPSRASDVFAMGITFWEVLTGQLPYSEHRHVNIAAQLPFMVLRGVRPALQALSSEVPSGLIAVMTRSWASSPGERGTAQQVVEALQAIIAAY